jgi:hypothetical protein
MNVIIILPKFFVFLQKLNKSRDSNVNSIRVHRSHINASQ